MKISLVLSAHFFSIDSRDYGIKERLDRKISILNEPKSN
jgi:hypothetical protein